MYGSPMQTVALFDVRVTDADAPSHSQRVVTAVLSSAEEEKKKKYSEAAALRRASFTPLVVSVDGVLGREANFFVNQLAQKLAHKWDKSNNEVIGRMRAQLIRYTQSKKPLFEGLSHQMEACNWYGRCMEQVAHYLCLNVML